MAPVSVECTEFGLVDALRSENFDLSDLAPSDVRRLHAGATEVLAKMSGEGLSFDEARWQLVLQQMASIGADVSGMPTDAKAFTFESGLKNSAPQRARSRRAFQEDNVPEETHLESQLGVQSPRSPTLGLKVGHVGRQSESRRNLAALLGPGLFTLQALSILGLLTVIVITVWIGYSGSTGVPMRLSQESAFLKPSLRDPVFEDSYSAGSTVSGPGLDRQ
mmetsp:Transcript_40101/g.106388  ORF Transcript_40101/g.106388 Transcript_40101/m.106388 type:complete len:220 (-) Transcript_40101:142-801(-)